MGRKPKLEKENQLAEWCRRIIKAGFDLNAGTIQQSGIELQPSGQTVSLTWAKTFKRKLHATELSPETVDAKHVYVLANETFSSINIWTIVGPKKIMLNSRELVLLYCAWISSNNLWKNKYSSPTQFRWFESVHWRHIVSKNEGREISDKLDVEESNRPVIPGHENLWRKCNQSDPHETWTSAHLQQDVYRSPFWNPFCEIKNAQGFSSRKISSDWETRSLTVPHTTTGSNKENGGGTQI